MYGGGYLTPRYVVVRVAVAVACCLAVMCAHLAAKAFFKPARGTTIEEMTNHVHECEAKGGAVSLVFEGTTLTHVQCRHARRGPR